MGYTAGCGIDVYGKRGGNPFGMAVVVLEGLSVCRSFYMDDEFRALCRDWIYTVSPLLVVLFCILVQVSLFVGIHLVLSGSRTVKGH